MTKHEFIMSTIRDGLGYNPEVDEDGDIKFCYEMKDVYLITSDDDEKYVSLRLLRVYRISDGDEMKALVACNKLTRDLKFLKVCIDPTHMYINAACEFIYSGKKSLVQNLRYSLEIFGVIRTMFRDKMDELSD